MQPSLVLISLQHESHHLSFGVESHLSGVDPDTISSIERKGEVDGVAQPVAPSLKLTLKYGDL
jgi:hypothetical protein